MPDAPNHKSPKKKFELKYEKRKKKKKRIVTEQAASPWILKKTTNDKPNIKPTTSPTDYKGSKDTDSKKKKKKKKPKPNICCKSLNQKSLKQT